MPLLNFIGYIFSIHDRVVMSRKKWPQRGYASKIFEVLLYVVLSAATIALTYWVGTLIGQISSKSLGKSIAMVVVLMFVGVLDVGMIIAVLEASIIHVITAFGARPKKIDKEARSIEIQQQIDAINNNTEGEVVSHTQELEGGKPKTSRVFDTIIAIISLVITVAFVAGVVFALMLGIGK